MRTLRVPERSTLIYYTMAASLFVIASLLGIVMWLGSEPPDSSVSNASPVFMQDRAQVLADRPVVINNQRRDIVLRIPCCSLGIGGTVTMVEREPDLFAQPYWLEEWNRPRVIHVEFATPAGEVVENAFSSTPIEVCFVLDEQQWQQYRADPTGFEIQYYDNMYRPYEWRRLSSYENEERNSLCAETARLSLFALAMMDNVIPVTGENEPYRP
jgi:hypothetical protein